MAGFSRRLGVWCLPVDPGERSRKWQMKTTIFISSVQKELAAERRALKDYVQGDPLLRKFFDVFLFEDLPASDRRADDVYLNEVDRCGVYVGLFGNEYGPENAEGISATEREFDRATAKGKVRLIFVKGTDDEGRHPQMVALVRKAGGQLIRRRFAGVAELTAVVYASLVEWLERTGSLRTKPFDAAACPDATLADLSRERLTEFLSVAKAERGYAIGPQTSTPKALTHLNLLDGGLPSHAAVLLFGKKPQRFLVTSEVKCMHFHGKEVEKPIPSYHIYKGTAFELADQAVDFVMSKMDRAVIPQDNAVASLVKYEIPYEAVREAIVNAITHRDYTSNTSVQVMLFADRLEVWNPGELPAALTIEDLRGPHPSIPHNPLIAEPMFLATYAEKAGSGILDMIKRCRLAGVRTPSFHQKGGQFVQTPWRPTTGPSTQVTAQVVSDVRVGAEKRSRELASALGLSAAQVTAQVTAQVVEVLGAAAGEGKSREQLQAAAGMKHREHFRKAYVEPLVNAGWIERTIPNKPTSRLQRYRLTDKGRDWLAGGKS